jgi:hypothetical protein
LRHRADNFEAKIDQRRHGQHDDGKHHYKQRDRATRQKFFPKQQQGNRGKTESEHRKIGIG